MSEETIPNNNDIVDKFRAYRTNVENTEKKFKESKIVIEQLKDEIQLSRDLEKNLRSQLSSAQIRLIQLQKISSKFITVPEKQRQIEKTSVEIDQKIEYLTEVVRQVREECKNLFEKASKQAEILKENEELKSILKSKDCQYDMMKIEVRELTKEKKEVIAEYQKKVNDMEKDLERLKREKMEVETQCNMTLLVYKKQIEENEQLIKEYEKERKSLLAEFDSPKRSDHGTKNFVSADSTVSINTEERGINPKIRNATQVESTPEADTQLFQCSSYESGKSAVAPRTKFLTFRKRPKSQQLTQTASKKKPPLDFLLSTQDSQSTPTEVARKRRLFSTNCNHYIN